MFPFPLRTTVSALSVLLHLSSIYVASGQSCGCTSIVIPVEVDVLVPKDPADPFGGLKSNASSLRRLHDMYDVFGVFCQPTLPLQRMPRLYNSWCTDLRIPTNIGRLRQRNSATTPTRSSPATVDSLPLPSIGLGVGLSSRPANASDVQYATGAAVLSQLAPHWPLFLGSLARGDTPLRWGALDPDYITTSNRSIFYPTDPTSFSPRMVIFDNFTKDVGSVSTVLQGAITSVTAHYTGPVAKVVGSEDRFFALLAAERILWPEAQSFEIVVAQGSGHDLNLDFFAKGPFNTFVGFVNQFTGL
ncbi:hypothetical protein B0H17DRAFT_1123509 [Mycena rosella]|uniref:Uncharacterized protein n=1 Tax=Mycena rosella TaxID=1033263 RepID=A0AAD7H2F9_MYCRO|nr:hypothetical protein B0H17DRAFT_1123509 [Mycena rosella]